MSTVLLLIVLIVALGVLFIYRKTKKTFGYWKERGVPHTGLNLWKTATYFFDKDVEPLEMMKEYYYDYYPHYRYYGSFQLTKPVLVVRDIELIKRITVKDFDHFVDRNSFITEEMEPLLARSLAGLKGQRWRDMRATLSPSFTGSKMRTMFVLLSECCQQFVAYLAKNESEIGDETDMKDVFTRFANDAIASVAFGLKCDSLVDRENEFYMMGKALNAGFGLKVLGRLIMIFGFPTLAKTLKIRLLSDKVTSFFRRIISQTLQLRETQNIVRPDMIQLLMEARKAQSEENSALQEDAKQARGKMTDDDITAQALFFFLAGFEITATIMCLVSHELAVHPEIQERLRKEVDGVMEASKGKITYDDLMGMKYLDMVVLETLRKWPTPLIDRVCDKDYTIQPVSPEEKRIVIEQGTQVVIPTYGIHRDPKYYPDPEKFDPERFSDENKGTIKPFTFFPFGLGPRNCIASRFALMENKLMVVHLLSKFDLVPVKKTCVPLKLKSKAFNMMPAEGFWLGIRKRI